MTDSLNPDPTAAGHDGESNAFDQSSIDDFLGLNLGPFGGAPVPVKEALVRAQSVSQARIPLIEAVLDRHVKALTSSARRITSDMVEIRLDRVTSQRFQPYLDSIALPALIAVFHAQPWGGAGLLTVDSALVYALVDVMFGGASDLEPAVVEGRPFSQIELHVLENFTKIVLDDLSTAFSAFAPVTFALSHFETTPRFAAIARPQSVIALATVRVNFGNLAGDFDLVLPLSTLEPVKDLFSGNFGEDKTAGEDLWQSALKREVMLSEATLTAVLDEIKVPLRQVLDYAIGDTILLEKGPQDRVELRCGDIVLSEGLLGRAGRHIAVSLTEAVRQRPRDP
ncbi:MAG: FliM/FliN family flagellar motor switch protein [Methylobacteriaceae bacterium]|nr:FliM/FliN family flagellar motor switch protein [Methylobacteriaceae bacterium]